MNNEIARREFGRLMGLGMISTAGMGSYSLSSAFGRTTPAAAEIVDRIRKKLAEEGVKWRRPGRTVDDFHLGNPGTKVTGIALCFMSTFDVLQRAVKGGINFIISHEPTFWNGFDDVSRFQKDPVYIAKKKFAEENDVVVWRFHDHCHAMRPDPIFLALTRQIGWHKYVSGSGTNSTYTIPETTLKSVALHIGNRLDTHNIRVVGDPNLKVRRIGYGIHDLASCMRGLKGNDAIIVGETRDFDTPLYFRDANNLNLGGGLLIISHERLEEFGMKDLIPWFAPLAPEVPVEFISSKEPFWIPNLMKER